MDFDDYKEGNNEQSDLLFFMSKVLKNISKSFKLLYKLENKLDSYTPKKIKRILRDYKINCYKKTRKFNIERKLTLGKVLYVEENFSDVFKEYNLRNKMPDVNNVFIYRFRNHYPKELKKEYVNKAKALLEEKSKNISEKMEEFKKEFLFYKYFMEEE